MAEQTLLSEGNVSVSTARFVVEGQMYPISGITSVKSLTQRPIKWPMILIAFGVISLANVIAEGNIDVLWFVVFFGGGGLLWMIKGVKYILVLSTASGEVQALTSRNQAFIIRIVNALNQAIVQRG